VSISPLLGTVDDPAPARSLYSLEAACKENGNISGARMDCHAWMSSVF
jgi:hypothetical protein